MEGWDSRVHVRCARWLVPAFLLAMPFVAAVLAKPKGENVHRPDGECSACHTNDRATLEQDRAAARALLAPDLEERCILCHGDQGPSHHTGIRPRKAVPAALPLSVEGLITCATCHFVHGEPGVSKDFLRIDNARGGLCLTCHELSELE
jgi:cytochrome c3-like protein